MQIYRNTYNSLYPIQGWVKTHVVASWEHPLKSTFLWDVAKNIMKAPQSINGSVDRKGILSHARLGFKYHYVFKTYSTGVVSFSIIEIPFSPEVADLAASLAATHLKYS